MSNLVLSQLDAALSRCNLENTRLVVGLSGGSDSLALTLGLTELQPTRGLELHLAHFDHGLRADSAADREFVQGVAAALGLPLALGQGDVRAIARAEGRGIEETARQERYAFLARVARQVGAAAVLVAHTREDQTETRLLHIVRGSGLRGLIGMREDATITVADQQTIRLVRPLLGVSKAELEEFCRERGWQGRLDPSNLDRAFTRNRLRHDVLPTLRSINPRLDTSLEHLARVAADAEELIQAELDRRLPSVVEIGEGLWVVDRARWRALPRALQRAALLRAWLALAPREASLGAADVDAALVALERGQSGKTLEWPGGVTIRLQHDQAVIGRNEPDAAPLPSQRLDLAGQPAIEVGPVAPKVVARTSGSVRPGETWLRLTGHLQGQACADRRGDHLHCDLDGTVLGRQPVIVRSRRMGDWLAPEGMNGRKKIQDLLVDERVPRQQRDQVPIVAAGDDVLWVVGLRRDRRFLATPACRHVLCLSAEPIFRRAAPSNQAASVQEENSSCAT